MANDLTWAVGELAELSTDEFDTVQLLRRLCEVAAQSLAVDGVGVMDTDTDRRNRYVHATSGALAELEALQEALQEGPCRDAVDCGSAVAAGSRAEMPWPSFVRTARQHGVQSVLALPLISRGRTWGTLDLYWLSDHRPSEQDRASAQLLANVAVSYLVMADDRASSRSAQQQLAQRALHDQLTGLPNRELMHELIDRALSAPDRGGTMVAVLFIDLDRFKPINDTFGHQTGDLVIQIVAQRIRQAVRAVDTVGRISGDEFLVVCQHVNDPDDPPSTLIHLGQRIRHTIAQPIHVPGVRVSVSASVGIAVTSERPSTADLVHRADAAMYQAKAPGSGGVVIDRHFTDGVAARPDLGRLLLEVAHRGEISETYRPIVTADGALAAVHAEVDWLAADVGVSDAGELLELAERAGSAAPLSRWLVNRAVDVLQGWRRDRPDSAPGVLFCRFGAGYLTAPELLDELADALRTHDLRPGDLGIEMPAHLASDPTIQQVVAGLHASGHPLAVVGAGAWQLLLTGPLMLPVSHVTLEPTLMAGLPEQPQARATIRAVLAMAAELQLTVIADGVATASQAQYLQSAGVHLLQGDHVGGPAPAGLFAERYLAGPAAPSPAAAAPVPVTQSGRPEELPLPAQRADAPPPLVDTCD